MDDAYNIEGVDGTLFGDELKRIEYAGDKSPGFIKPHAYIEPHIEQGPVLDKEQIQIGAVGNLQGICRHQITVHGTANHAGTTPADMRQDAMQAAARFMTMVQDYIHKESPDTVATVGTIELEPDAMTIIPSKAIFSLDFREPDKERYEAARQAVSEFMKEVEEKYDVTIETEELVNFEPVKFDDAIVEDIYSAAERRGFTVKHMTSGAGHDAQMIARICPTAMIFVPSKDGISHNPEEFTEEEDLGAGAAVLLDTVLKLMN